MNDREVWAKSFNDPVVTKVFEVHTGNAPKLTPEAIKRIHQEESISVLFKEG